MTYLMDHRTIDSEMGSVPSGTRERYSERRGFHSMDNEEEYGALMDLTEDELDAAVREAERLKRESK